MILQLLTGALCLLIIAASYRWHLRDLLDEVERRHAAADALAHTDSGDEWRALMAATEGTPTFDALAAEDPGSVVALFRGELDGGRA